jgi:hypothetical protein
MYNLQGMAGIPPWWINLHIWLGGTVIITADFHCNTYMSETAASLVQEIGRGNNFYSGLWSATLLPLSPLTGFEPLFNLRPPIFPIGFLRSYRVVSVTILVAVRSGGSSWLIMSKLLNTFISILLNNPAGPFE